MDTSEGINFLRRTQEFLKPQLLWALKDKSLGLTKTVKQASSSQMNTCSFHEGGTFCLDTPRKTCVCYRPSKPGPSSG